MDNFNFNLLKYFYYIVLYNGFTNASRNLSVAQPSLSLNVKKLEEELGYKVIERNSKQFLLTEEGRNLYNNIKPFFDNIKNNLNIKQNSTKYSEINIAIRYSYSFLLTCGLIKKIITLLPDIKINIKLYSKLDINKLKDKSYDLVIDDVDYLKLMNGVNIDPIIKVNNYFVCGDPLVETYKNIKKLSELDQAKFISYNPSLKLGKLKKICYENNVSFIDTISVNESDLFYDFLNNGFGISVTNELFLKKYDKLNIIKIEDKIFNDELGISYINRNDIVNKIIELIKIEIKENI